MSDIYGFTREPTATNAPNTVNASHRQQQANELEDIKTTIRVLTKDVEDLKKAVDQLTIDVYRKN